MFENVKNDSRGHRYDYYFDYDKRYDKRLRKSRSACEVARESEHQGHGFGQYLKAEQGSYKVPGIYYAEKARDKNKWKKHYVEPD